jgi:NitT/TauT family transport system permease protein
MTTTRLDGVPVLSEPARISASMSTDAGTDAVTDANARASADPRTNRSVRWTIRIASLTAAIAAWELLTAHQINAWIHFSNLPTAGAVAADIWRQLHAGQYYQDIGASLLRIVLGFTLAAVLGVASGIAIARSRLAEDVLRPLFEVTRPIPAIALVPIAILAFPGNEQGMVFITMTAAFFPIMVSTRHAVRALPTVVEEAVRTLGAGRWAVLRRVVLPGALPGIFSGLSVGMGVAWICVISAEMISGQYGVGYRTWEAYTVVDYPSVVVGMLTIGLLGGLSSAVVELAGRRLTRWLPRGETGRS